MQDDARGSEILEPGPGEASARVRAAAIGPRARGRLGTSSEHIATALIGAVFFYDA
jgi:hypothetical protein